MKYLNSVWASHPRISWKHPRRVWRILCSNDVVKRNKKELLSGEKHIMKRLNHDAVGNSNWSHYLLQLRTGVHVTLQGIGATVVHLIGLHGDDR
mmetsp:Transcript_50869/g.122629  ORF Transcript_50869/g.122629 Transcript_50869/m.122629 type:complete len:94 (+) Transcript_50869:997-1278(+)